MARGAEARGAQPAEPGRRGAGGGAECGPFLRGPQDSALALLQARLAVLGEADPEIKNAVECFPGHGELLRWTCG